jgi:NAD(P)-dependent dehydrogenase (short-subunit alcohol dehydrogenase family)
MSLAEKRVLVTGGAVRLGAAICRRLAREGALISIHYRQSVTEAEALIGEFGGKSSGHRLCSCDLRNPDAVAHLIDEAGPVDILVNNASVFRPVPLADETLADAMDQFFVNFWAPLALMQAFRRQGRDGCIVNLLDQRIRRVADDGSYSLSKKALADATLAAARQWGPTIRVNAVAPGAVLPPKDLPNAVMARARREMPLDRPPSPEDIADACLYLIATPAVTGQILFLDGGQHLTAGVALAPRS